MPGIYSQLCKKILLKKILLKIEEPKEIHHLFPLHLSLNEFLNENELDRTINTISVYQIIHFILHFFKYLKFGEYPDYAIFPLFFPFGKTTIIFTI